jgi:ribonuclease R
MTGSRRAHHARPIPGRASSHDARTRARNDRPAPARQPLGTERHLGHVEWQRSRWTFAPARRIPQGRRPLTVPDGLAVEVGDFVVAEFRPDREDALLVEVFGSEDDPRHDDASVASRHRLPVAFSAAAEHEATAFARPALAKDSARLDLTDRVTFTMDPADARDFDDALSWRPLSGGACEVGIHIADVAHYVRPGTALDADATERGTSVYLAEGAIPMLPHRLSSDLCSLVPNQPRFSMSVLAEMDSRGGVTHYRIVEGLIESRARLAYEQGQAILDGDAAARAAVPAEVVTALEALAGIAHRLRDRRMKRGALDLDVAEIRARVNPAGGEIVVERRTRVFTMELIEEFMLLANLLVGEEGERRDGPFLYRVHAIPALARVAALERMLAALGLPRLDGANGIAGALQGLLAAHLAPEKRRLLHVLVLRTLARAEYAPDDIGHFGLAVRGYCHFTSPIRRYPDLFNHRRVKSWLGADDAFEESEREMDVARLAHTTTYTEQRAQEAERESTRVKALRVAMDHLGEVHDGVVTGVVPVGLFVELTDIPVDGFVRVSTWVNDEFTMDEAGVRLEARHSRRRFTLGDRLTVRLVRVDIAARELELALEGPGTSRATGGRHAKKRKDPGIAIRKAGEPRRGRAPHKGKGRKHS